ncbi:hypothetical protein AD006_28740 (plasmid) [Pseudonocardia sp. EC080610-09]|uniref:MFS transporter n=1 Tax=unclassified Pseudonocardia TaxID=2619320 RepID=UPI000705C263|nr:MULTISPECIES: MFS transporter [unclassified Pseudonocardia]ALL79305.1 hypothetical protein AD006_28740 [Pseudonocardia sp. EC080610-09]ALL85275.1 hypothetical protein AD017_29130 [Pseudonocardia sp. EC080619-01]
MPQNLTRRSWLVVAGSTLALIVGSSPIILQTSGLFMIPLGEEFGWTRTEVSGAKSIAGVVAASVVVVIGFAIDRFGLRRVMIPLVTVFAAAMAAIALTPNNLLVFYGLLIIASALGAAQNPPAYIKAVAGWFDRKRGLAIGLAICGTGLGTSLVPQYTQFLIDTVGWRGGYAGLGLLVLVIALPCWLFLVREPTRDERTELGFLPASSSAAGSDGTPAQLPGVDRATAVRTRQFWILVLGTLVASIALNGAAAHLVPMLVDGGMTAAQAAAVLLPVGIASLVARPLAGFLLDRFHGPTIAAIQQLMPIGGFALIASGWSPVLGAVMFGLAIGIEVDLGSFLTTRYFGLLNFGKIYGIIFAIFVLGSAVGGLIFALSFDYAGGYGLAFVVISVALVLTSASFLALGRYPFPVAHQASPARREEDTQPV